MSILSSQVDKLREMATRYDELKVGAVKAVTMPSDMGSILRDAADTIWQLRDDLQRANAENAKLRELVDAAHMSRLLTENENEKLLELLQRTWDAFHDATAREFVTVKNELREFGIEVDDA